MKSRGQASGRQEDHANDRSDMGRGESSPPAMSYRQLLALYQHRQEARQQASQEPVDEAQLLDISHFVTSLDGHVTIELTLSHASVGAVHIALPEGVGVQVDELANVIRLEGDAEDVQLVLGELQLMMQQHYMKPFYIEVRIVQDDLTMVQKIPLVMKGDSGLTILKHHASSGSSTVDEQAVQQDDPVDDGSEPLMPLFETPDYHSYGEVLEVVRKRQLLQERPDKLEPESPPVVDASPLPPMPGGGAPPAAPVFVEVVHEPVELPPIGLGIPGKVGAIGLQFDGLPSDVTVTEDHALALPAFSVVAGAMATVQMTLSDADAGSLNVGTLGTAVSLFDAAAGIWQVSGGTADVNAVLAGLTFTPTADYDQNITFQIAGESTGFTPTQTQVEVNFVAVDDPVVIASAIPDQSAQVGGAFLLNPAAVFDDPDTNDTLTYSAQLAGGGALPAWLGFDPATGVLSGTPANGDIATLSIELTATDMNSNSVTDAFDVQVTTSILATNISQTTAVTEDVAKDLTAMQITSLASNATVTLTLSDPLAGSLNADSAGAAAATYDSGTGVWQVSGAISDINTLLADLTFTPADDYDQSITVVVSIDDGLNLPLMGTMNLNVTAVDDDPTVAAAPIDQIVTATNPFSLDLSAVFDDVDTGDSLTLSVTQSDGSALPGWLSFNAGTNILSGTPAPGDIGTLTIRATATDSVGGSVFDDFGLEVSDGGIIFGTPNADSISGSNADNEIYGLADNDTIDGLGGRDTIDGEAGDDSIDGGLGRDTLLGGDGNDTIFGGHYTSGNDHQDSILGGAGNDLIHGGYHHDTLYGNDGDDTIDGNWHNDLIYGNAGNDWLFGGRDTDYIHAVSGDDTLLGGAGRDLLYGGTGADRFVYLSVSDSSGTSRDNIYSFTQGQDVIDLSQLGFSGIGDLTIAPGGTTIITDPASTFRLDLIGNYTLTAADFIFSSTVADVVIDDHATAIDGLYNLALPTGMFASVDDGNLSFHAFQSDGSALPLWLQMDAATGTLSGTPDSGDIGQYDLIIRTVNGSGVIAHDQFTLAVAESVILGTAANDTLAGTAGDDAIYGLGSDDSISAGAGSDYIRTGSGNDTIFGEDDRDTIDAGDGDNSIDGGLEADSIVSGSGDDVIIAGPDNTNNDRSDTVYSGAGNDTVYGGRYHDRLYGEDGDDSLQGQYHNDTLYGGAGDDTLDGGFQNDYLYAGEGNDILYGGNNEDRLYGEAGLNYLIGGSGRDSMFGGSGIDIIVINDVGESSGSLRDRIYYFAQGQDKVDISALGYTSLADFTMTQGAVTTIEDAATGFRLDFESNLTLTANDFLFAVPQADGDITDQFVIAGAALNVTLGGGHFASIDDGNLLYQVTYDGGSLPSWLAFDEGSLTLSGTSQSSDIGLYPITIRATNASGDVAEDSFELFVTENIIDGTAAADTLVGTAGADVISAFDDADSVTGGDGNDIIYGHDGNDTLYGEGHRDTIQGGAGDDFIDGGYDKDTLYGGTGNDTIIGGHPTSGAELQDVIYGEDGNDYIDGGRHHDTLDGGAGNDTIYGGVHNDQLFGGAGNDLLHGGTQTDYLYAQAGNNVIVGWTHRDYIYAGSGNDVIVMTDITHSQGNNRDYIYYFEQGQDMIDLTRLGFTDVSDFTRNYASGWTQMVDAVTNFQFYVRGNLTLTNADFYFSAAAADGDLVREITQVDSPYALTIPGGHFASINDGNLTYSLLQEDGNVTPYWLQFDAATGAISGTPTGSDLGAMNLTVRATNGSGLIAEDTFELVVAGNSLLGTAGVDSLTGTAGDDGIFGLGDDDTISGEAGNDVLYGDAGDDSVSGGDGNDVIYGGDGDDFLEGNHGSDSVYGGDGKDTIIGGHPTNGSELNDRLYGEGGEDYIDAGRHHDTVYGGDDNDTLYGGVHNDYLYGDAGMDLLLGGNNEDRLYGLDGDDVLIGGAGRDSYWGGAGNDVYVITKLSDSSGSLRDRYYEFVQGEDRIDISALGYTDISQLTITPGTTTIVTDPMTGLRIDIQQNLTLTNADFIFSVGVADNPIADEQGSVNNLLTVATTAATAFTSIDDGNLSYALYGTNGNDGLHWLRIDSATGVISGTPDVAGTYDLTIRATNGSGVIATDQFVIFIADSSITGTAAADMLTGDASVNLIEGLGGDDSISGGDGNDILRGDAGADTIFGNNQDDYIVGGDGNDVIDGGYHYDLIYGGAGDDTIYGGPDNTSNDRSDTIYGGDGNDSIHGGQYYDLLYGEDGNDSMKGGVHNDTLYGGDGDDTLYGERHNDVLVGGDGNDRLGGNDHNDTLTGGAGRDTLLGGANNDVFVFLDVNDSTAALKDRITDFEQGLDVIDLSALGATVLGDLTLSDDGSNTTISYGATFVMQLHGVYSLTGGDFVFAWVGVIIKLYLWYKVLWLKLLNLKYTTI